MVAPRVAPSEECASSAVVASVGDDGAQQVGITDVLPTITDELMCCCVSMVVVVVAAAVDDDDGIVVAVAW